MSGARTRCRVSVPEIQGYRFGEMVVDGQAYEQDLILLPDRVVSGWRRKQGHRLDPDDLRLVLQAQAEVLVVGTGAHGMMEVPASTREAVCDAGLELHVAPSGKAWLLYNERRSVRPTAGAFHLTC